MRGQLRMAYTRRLFLLGGGRIAFRFRHWLSNCASGHACCLEWCRTTLWNRLAQHRGTTSLGGNHRGSVFRKLVGQALAARKPSLEVATWGRGQSAAQSVRIGRATSGRRSVSLYRRHVVLMASGQRLTITEEPKSIHRAELHCVA